MLVVELLILLLLAAIVAIVIVAAIHSIRCYFIFYFVEKKAGAIAR